MTPARRGQLHLARHHQVRPQRAAQCPRRRARARAATIRAKRAARAERRRSVVGARRFLRRPQRQGQGRQDRSADRPRRRAAPHHPGAVPPLEEQPDLCRRRRRRQDRDRRGPRPQDRRGRCARGAARRDDLCARHGLAARRHPLSRRLRRAAQGRDEGAREARGRDPLHRRDPHRDRRRRHLGRRARCIEPAEARAGVGQHALHRLDHLQGVPPVLREGPGAGAPLPEDRRRRADDPRCDRDREGPASVLRGLPQAQVHRRRAQGGRRAFGPLHQRPQAAGQGDRRDRRDRREPDAGDGGPAQAAHRRRGHRGRPSPRWPASRPSR